MNKEEYLIEKQKIQETFGVPEYDNSEAVNESAKRMVALRTEYRLSCRMEKMQKAKDKGQKQKEEIKDLVKPYSRYSPSYIGVMEINDNDLLPFNTKEREIIRIKFDNWNLTHKEIAMMMPNTSRQMVTGLLDSPAFKILQAKFFNKLIPLEINIALLAAVRAGDTKIVTRLAEHYKILNPEKMEIDLNKPIEDPIATKMLKELGDKLIDGNQDGQQDGNSGSGEGVDEVGK